MIKKYCLLGASSGLAHSLILKLKDEDYQLILMARDINSLKEKLKIIEFKHAPIYKILDANKNFDDQDVIETIKKSSKIINFIAFTEFNDFSNFENIERQVKVNCEFLAKLLYICSEEGCKVERFIHIGSLVSSIPTPYLSLYSASKSFSENLILSLANERSINFYPAYMHLNGMNTKFHLKAGMPDRITQENSKYLTDKDVVAESLKRHLETKEISIYGDFYSKIFKWISALISKQKLAISAEKFYRKYLPDQD